MTVLVETRHPGEFILSEANGQRSREAITIASGAGIIAAGRVFGEEVAVERLQSKIAERAAEASQIFALTEEYHRINILKTGRLLDADGAVLFDYFTEFGETPAAEIDFDLDNATPPEGGGHGTRPVSRQRIL
jgi:hypothetical protein